MNVEYILRLGETEVHLKITIRIDVWMAEKHACNGILSAYWDNNEAMHICDNAISSHSDITSLSI